MFGVSRVGGFEGAGGVIGRLSLSVSGSSLRSGSVFGCLGSSCCWEAQGFDARSNIADFSFRALTILLKRYLVQYIAYQSHHDGSAAREYEDASRAFDMPNI
jgi:hypothetical protein